MNKYFYHVVIVFLLVLNGCGDRPDAPTSKTTDASIESQDDKLVRSVWNQIKLKNFAEVKERNDAFLIMAPIFKLPQNEQNEALRKLATLKDKTGGIGHKIAAGAINKKAKEIFLKILSAFPDDAAKKTFVEQADNGKDILSSLLVRNVGKIDDEASLNAVVDQVTKLKPSVDHSVSAIWNVVRPADFSVRDDKRTRAMSTLKRLFTIPDMETRGNIARAIAVKDDMETTRSGLLQTIVQAPIDEEIVAIVDALIKEHKSPLDKRNFLNQKLGVLKEPALTFLTDANVSKTAPANGIGVRFKAGELVSEKPHLNKLLAMLLVHGADGQQILSSAPDGPEQKDRINNTFDRIFASGAMDAFVGIFRGGEFITDNTGIFFDWAFVNPARAIALKTLLNHPEAAGPNQQSLKSQAFQYAILKDFQEIVTNNDPIKVGGLLGFGTVSLYTGPVALRTFNFILDNNYGLTAFLKDHSFAFGDQGTIIAFLSLQIALSKTVSVDKRKAMIRTVSQKLKSFMTPEEWKNLVLTPTLTLQETAPDILVKELNITNAEAENILGIK